MSANPSAYSTGQIDRELRAALTQLAHQSGVQTSYIDMAGRSQTIDTDAMLAVLRALGITIEHLKDAPQCLQQARQERAARVVEPVHVIWKRGSQLTPIPLRLPKSSADLLTCCWHLEDGETLRVEIDGQERRGLKRKGGSTWRLSPPRHLPVGYHRLTIETSRSSEESHVFCAPERCFAGSHSRAWGVFAPHYALHTKKSWGSAGFNDLGSFTSWLAEQGASFFGTLPLLPQFLDKPCEPSPYSPVSRLFWNEFLVDLEDSPEFERNAAARRLVYSTSFQNTLQKFRRAPQVDYRRQMAQKRKVLEILARSFFRQPSPRRRELEAFVRANPRLWDYARFRAVQEEQGDSWRRWPPRMRQGELRDGDCRLTLHQYHLYVQWLAAQQMARLAGEARRKKVELYLDVPLGTHRDGYDTWRHQDIFAHDVSGGAPPDPVFTRGQDWGFAPVHPIRSREQGHTYLRACLQHHFQHARMLRFDHIMGLHRLYWVPRGMPASQGAYVAYPAEEFYAILSIESHRHHAAVIGENLGTIPPGVNKALSRHGVNGMYVVQYQLAPGRRALSPIGRHQVASINTHDMPPFTAFCTGLDIEDRVELGLISSRDRVRCQTSRQRLVRSLVLFLKKRGFPASGPGEIYQGLAHYLGASRARWLMLNLEDLWLETASQNTPGTRTERVNWRRKVRWSIDELREGKAPMNALKVLRQLRPR
jgi:4-alpha-glucanotransferase